MTDLCRKKLHELTPENTRILTDGRRSCRPCTRAWQSDYRTANRSEIRVLTHAARYGLTTEDARDELASKPTSCDLCGASDRRICRDHDHTTMELRGWLCEQCNLGVGLIGDNLESVRRVVDYLS